MSSRELTEITVVGNDDTGLVARVTTLLFERDINIEDVDQAVRDGIFRMTMLVETSEMTVDEHRLRRDLSALGDDLSVDVRVRFPSERDTRQVAVLVTKESHCLQRLLSARSELDAEIGVVIGNHDDLESVAERHGIPFHDVGDENGSHDEEQLLSVLDDYDIDLLALARFMRILSPEVVFRYEGRIINIHPSLLPAFPGAKAYRQAKEAGVRVAGVTAHYVTTDLDQGPIVTQRVFNVPDDATVEEMRERGQPLEADALLEAVRLHLNDDVSIRRGRTELGDSEESYSLGMPTELDEVTPDGPVDGDTVGDLVADSVAESDD
ncbi:formyltetrahydrofolate deformylase [Haladaptatus litoreus]|uniref:Formyltetrahydrofolate deformylase n=1 Tax=Haladaptatus litoreus TaxID=553468 RepID=A0A1N7B4Z8_9EURY|nr:formyltetrahydrofolate deformylase [Haladaptatus litoreus]SIR46362.1 formyltetrahydrofolate deformylase [Haladaptatus litoreus]